VIRVTDSFIGLHARANQPDDASKEAIMTFSSFATPQAGVD
jgi:hypothetical protein